MHYSVLESSGHVEILVVKKVKELSGFTFGIRTI